MDQFDDQRYGIPKERGLMEEEELNPTLKIIRDAARQMAAERSRLNQVFTHLQSAVMSFDPTMYLSDSGELVKRDELPPEFFSDEPLPVTPPRLVEVPGEAAAGHNEAEAAAVRRDADEAKEYDQKKALVAAFVLQNPRVTYNAVMKSFPTYNTKWILSQLVDQGIVKEDSTGLLSHKDWKPQEASTEPASTKGSGRRQDVSPGPTRSPGVAQSTPGDSTASSSPSDSTSKTYGLARSPKPRDGMRTQLREREERLDKLVLWALEQPGGVFEALTAAHEKPEVFGDRNKTGYDFRELEERGIFVRTGRQIHPAWKVKDSSVKGGGRGRTTSEYRVAEGIAKSDVVEQAENFKKVEESALPKA